jgi:hypothetical protein
MKALAGHLLLAFREPHDALVIALGWCIMDKGADIIRLQYSHLTGSICLNHDSLSICKSLSKTARKESSDIQPVVTLAIPSTNDNFCILRIILGVDVCQGFFCIQCACNNAWA